ncbi:hypothetical protein [Streptomyces sp. NRRL F-5123]|uniref:zinc finger domain-containing protein n=1 Tax=Streptomyces sp. NRRL F-5123 TaxID=1463856 RepID=UPI0004E1A51A|nr:hypothetical protein [Streptomyces sp. NRRL F-5123]
MTDISQWGHWRPHFRSGEASERIRAWYRRVPCPRCGSPADRSCRTAAGHPTEHHLARRNAAGDPPYEEWRKDGLLPPARKVLPPILTESRAAQGQYTIDRPLGDAVAMTSHVITNWLGIALGDEAALDQFDQTALDLVLARGPEGTAEVMTVLAVQLAATISALAGPGSDPGEYLATLIHTQVELSRQRQRIQRTIPPE